MAKRPKDEVHYQTRPKGDERCGVCKHFIPPNRCEGVAGEISPHGWCDRYAHMNGERK